MWSEQKIEGKESVTGGAAVEGLAGRRDCLAQPGIPLLELL